MANDETLLQRHKPLLVALAQDPDCHRPWNHWFESVHEARGDYHPCLAEFFLSFVVQRAAPRSFWAGVFGDPGHPPPTGLDALKSAAAAVSPETTLGWEIDLGPIESQDAAQAWQAYKPMLQGEQPFQPTIYGRCVRQAHSIGLEYWFLYIYNDAPNRHEGDWEMVAIELNAAEEPVQAGYASHRSGLRRPWANVEQAGDRPVVYVARGSHASYFDHKKGGHRTNSFVVPHKGLPAFIESAMGAGVSLLQSLIVYLKLEDQTPTHPSQAGDEPLNEGEFVDPDLQVLSDPLAATPESSHWWMRLRCPWGSRHTRLLGDTAPDPPWEQGQKWNDPVTWIRSLELDGP